MSETAGFTPGPWRLCQHLVDHDQCPCGYRGGIWGSDGEHMVCEIGSTVIPGEEALTPPRYSRDIEIANARLIAAAPSLYEALEGLLSIVADSHGVDGFHLNGDTANWGEFEEVEQAYAALAKARAQGEPGQ